MAADNETRLISKAIRDRDIKPLLIRGVDESWFVSDEDRMVWKFLQRHWSLYQEVPTPVTVKDNFPNYRLLNVEDSIEYLLDQLHDYRMRQATIGIVRESAELIEGEADGWRAALLSIQKGLVELERDNSTSRDLDLTQKALERLNEYRERKSLPNGMRGIPTGLGMIDKATAGLQAGQLVTIIAPPKTGKSTLALQIAHNVHRAGHVPMFLSFEMSNDEQVLRYDAMRSGINHFKLMTGTLERDEEVRYERALKELEQHPNHFWLCDTVGTMTVSALSAKVQIIQPDIVFVDGVYLMQDEVTGEANTAQAITNITRSLKRLAQKIQKPVVISTQVLTWKMKGKKVTADSIGYSSSFYQDSDVIIGLERDGDDALADSTRTLRIIASRNCGPDQVGMEWDWTTGKFVEASLDEDADYDDY